LYRARLAYVIVYTAVAAYAPFLQPYYRSLGISLAGVGALSAFSSAVAMISAPMWGIVHDRHPASRWLIPFAGAIAASGGLGLGLSAASWTLIPSAAAFSMGMSGVSPMMDVRVLHMTRSDRSRYASVRVWGSIGFILATPVIGFAIAQTYRGLFLFLVPAIVAGSFASLLLPGRPATLRSPGMMHAPGRVLQHRPIAFFLAGALVGWVAIAAQNPFFSIYLGELGASSNQVGLAWSSQALLEIPSMVFFPLLMRRFGAERLIVAGMVILVMRQTSNAVFTTPTILIFCSLLQGLGYGLLLVGGIAYVSQQAPKGTAATAQGILNAVTFSLASIVGAGVGGQLAGLLSIRILFALSAGLGAIAVVLIGLAVLPGAAERQHAALAEAAPAAGRQAEREPRPGETDGLDGVPAGPLVGAPSSAAIPGAAEAPGQ
jgi:PPP family 3-phenylpropionic acid transporter